MRARLISPKVVRLKNPEVARLKYPKAAELINPKAARLSSPMAAGLTIPEVAEHCGHHVDAVAFVQALQGDLHVVQVEVVEAVGEEEHQQVPVDGLHVTDCQLHFLVRIQSQVCADLTTFLVHTFLADFCVACV